MVSKKSLIGRVYYTFPFGKRRGVRTEVPWLLGESGVDRVDITVDLEKPVTERVFKTGALERLVVYRTRNSRRPRSTRGGTDVRPVDAIENLVLEEISNTSDLRQPVTHVGMEILRPREDLYTTCHATMGPLEGLCKRGT